MTTKKKTKNKHLNIIVTESEYHRIKAVCFKYGSLSLIARRLIMNFIAEQEDLKRAKDSNSVGEGVGGKDTAIISELMSKSGDKD